VGIEISSSSLLTSEGVDLPVKGSAVTGATRKFTFACDLLLTIFVILQRFSV
jgi:hypothetical protein